MSIFINHKITYGSVMKKHPPLLKEQGRNSPSNSPLSSIPEITYDAAM